jgi:hypothetical protein
LGTNRVLPWRLVSVYVIPETPDMQAILHGKRHPSHVELPSTGTEDHRFESCRARLESPAKSMLNQGRELAALIQTKLTLVVAMASGDNPVKASGLLFDLPRRHLQGDPPRGHAGLDTDRRRSRAPGGLNAHRRAGRARTAARPGWLRLSGGPARPGTGRDGPRSARGRSTSRGVWSADADWGDHDSRKKSDDEVTRVFVRWLLPPLS